ncbi:MAG: carboxypeptidase regulatory-like domain-containing protein [Planctomycetaceae bacterium]|nr:carboxypeptidase regulatory-like domain-containing protein [Planctomycetaceae bacterium]
MKGFRFLKEAALSLACLGILIPQPGLLAATPKQEIQNAPRVNGTTVVDVVLSKGGTVIGKVVDHQGNIVEGAAVTITQGDKEVVKTVSNSKGLFGARNMTTGTYKITAGQGSREFRLWSADAAPPKALSKAVLVSDYKIVRGQPVMGGIDIITGLLLAGVATGTTFAIINNNDINDLEDKLDSQNQQLNSRIDDLETQLAEIEAIVTM